MSQKKRTGAKITARLIFDGGEKTTISKFITAGDTTVTFGEGHMPMDVHCIRVVGGQVQIGGLYKYGSLFGNREQVEYEQRKMLLDEHYNNVVFGHLHELDELEIKIYSDSYLKSMELPPNYNIGVHKNQIVHHKPLPYFRRGVLVQPPIRKATIKNLNLISYICDSSPQVEIEPYEHKEWDEGHTFIHLIRPLSESTDNWDISFGAFICKKLELAMKYKRWAYLRNNCLDTDMLPRYLQKGDSFFGNEQSLLTFSSVLDSAPSNDVMVMFRDIMACLGQKAIYERMYCDIGGGKVLCGHSNQQYQFGVRVNNYLFDAVVKEKYLKLNNIPLVAAYHGYNLEFETTLDESSWLSDLLNETNLRRVFGSGTVMREQKLQRYCAQLQVQLHIVQLHQLHQNFGQTL